MVAHSMAGHVIEESYHWESRVVIDDHQILLSNEFEDVSAKFLPWPGWKVRLHNVVWVELADAYYISHSSSPSA